VHFARLGTFGGKRKGTPSGVRQDHAPTPVILSDGAKRRVEGPPYFVFALAVAFAFALTGGAQTTHKKLNLNLDEPYNRPHIPTHECRSQDWVLLNKPQAQALLADYGYEQNLLWTCEAIDVPWLPSAKIIRLHAAVELDDYRAVTLVQANPNSRVWLIPTYFGMVSFPHTEQDPHNLAAFNDLLRVAALNAKDNQLIDLSNLYQSILHMDEWFDPEHTPKIVHEATQISDIAFALQHDAHGTTLTHRERTGDSVSKTYLVWEFYFTNTSGHTHLTNVSRQTLDKYNEDN
jgi:hypothetical protein